MVDTQLTFGKWINDWFVEFEFLVINERFDSISIFGFLYLIKHLMAQPVNSFLENKKFYYDVCKGCHILALLLSVLRIKEAWSYRRKSSHIVRNIWIFIVQLWLRYLNFFSFLDCQPHAGKTFSLLLIYPDT